MNQQRRVEESIREQLAMELDAGSDTLLDWGAWYSQYFFVFDDGVESSRTLRRHDLRLWGRATFEDGAHDLYARLRLGVLDFNSGDSYDGDDDDTEGPNLERGVYRFDLSRWLRQRGQAVWPVKVVARGGRDLFQFGGGLSLSIPLDHVAVELGLEKWFVTGFWGKTVGSIQDIDLSRPLRRTHRDFYGFEVRYKGFERHEPYTYAFWQDDRNRESRPDFRQRFDYNSFYVGAGSDGELAPNLRYTTEWVLETGRSFGHDQNRLDDEIHAFAGQVELEYLFRGPHRARTSVEYLFASGDADRFASPTNAIGGNVDDRRDEGFVGFGYKDTGLSFAPTPANLHMWRIGASCFPWPKDTTFRELEVGTDWYLFYKHHRDAAVSDPTATRRSGYLGSEMDYFANWRVTADFAWTARVGVFVPGSAFDDRTTRTFVLVGLTWSF